MPELSYEEVVAPPPSASSELSFEGVLSSSPQSSGELSFEDVMGSQAATAPKSMTPETDLASKFGTSSQDLADMVGQSGAVSWFNEQPFLSQLARGTVAMIPKSVEGAG